MDSAWARLGAPGGRTQPSPHLTSWPEAPSQISLGLGGHPASSHPAVSLSAAGPLGWTGVPSDCRAPREATCNFVCDCAGCSDETRCGEPGPSRVGRAGPRQAATDLPLSRVPRSLAHPGRPLRLRLRAGRVRLAGRQHLRLQLAPRQGRSLPGGSGASLGPHPRHGPW